MFHFDAGTASTEREILTSLPLSEQGLYGLAPDRGVYDLHRMGHRHVFTHLLEGGLYLEHAAGVRGNDHLGTGLEDVSRLALAELHGWLGLDHVVDAGRAAADLCLGDLLDLHPRYLLEVLPGLLAHSLRMRKVARIVVRCRDRQRVPLGNSPYLLQELRDVLDLRRELLRSVGVLGVVTQEIRVLLHGRAASGGVYYDVVQVLLLESVDGLAGEVQGLFLAPGVGGESPTTALVLGGDYLAALGGEHADGRGVDLGEEYLLHAAGEDADSLAPLADWRGVLRDLLFLSQL